MKKPTSEMIETVLATLGGVAVGAFTSRLAVAAINTPKATDEAGKKKEALILLGTRGVIIAGSTAGACFIPGKDIGSVLGRSVLIGMGGMQILDAGTDLAAKTPAIANGGTKAKKVLAKALGLGCPTLNGYSDYSGPGELRGYNDMPVMDSIYNASAPSLAGARRRRRALRGVENIIEYPSGQMNALDMAVQSGAEMG